MSAGALPAEQGKGTEGMLPVALPWFALGSAVMANGLCRVLAATLASRGRSRPHPGSILTLGWLRHAKRG